MKKLPIIAALYFLFVFNAYTQNSYKPFDLKNIEWDHAYCYANQSTFPPTLNYTYTTYKICNDTVLINSRNYRTIHAHIASFFPPSPPSNYFTYGFLRQDSILKRTYFRLPGWIADSLLMDYNLNVGDTVKRGHYYFSTFWGNTSCVSSWTVKKIGNVIIGNGLTAKAFYTDTLNGAPSYFIEGAGHPFGIFLSDLERYCLPFEYCADLGQVKYENSCVLTVGLQENNLLNHISQIFPNPNMGSFKIQVSADLKNAKIILINSTGQKVLEQKIGFGENEIHTEGISDGIYNCILYSGDQPFQCNKLSIQH